ncbi:MAG: O-antigen ligase family protein [Bacillota bacterium]|nr:O-antigen ligase family protein [Bacillota bacterium]
MGVCANSLILRGLLRLIETLRRYWGYSLAGRLIACLRRCYETSAAAALYHRCFDVDNYAAATSWGRLMARGRALSERLGDILRGSLFYRALCALAGGYRRLTANSRIFGYINRLGLRQWLLVAFAMYLPLEFMIRDTLGAALLASVWEELFIAAAAVYVLWRRALRQTPAIARETPLEAYLLLFIAVGALLMTVMQPYPAIAFAGYRIVVEYLLWFFLMIRLIEDDRDLRVLYFSLLLLAAFITLHGVYQYIIGVEIPDSWVSRTELGVRTRVFSLTGSPNILGSLLVLTAPLAAALIYYCKNGWWKLFFLGMTCMMFLALLFTFSRGAWVGMLVTVFIFAMFIDRRLIALMAAGAASVLAFVPSITSRITYLFTEDYAVASAVGGRALRWETGRLLLDEVNPWFGFGLGRFGGAVAMDNQIMEETETFSYFYMDNYYLKTMVEMGYIGLIVYVLLILALLLWGMRAIRRSGFSLATGGGDALTRNSGNVRVLAVAILSGLCGVLVHCLFENIFEEPYMSSYFWGLAAMLIYIGFFRKNTA